MSGPTLQLTKTVPEILKEFPDRRLKARELAELIFERFPDVCEAKKAKSAALHSDADLIQQIVAEISALRPAIQRKYPQVRVTEGRPRDFYWSDKSPETEVAEANAASLDAILPLANLESLKSDGEIVSEHSLYPLLGDYLATEFSVDLMRIDEHRSSNKRGPNGNRWLYPDVVGIEDLTRGWDRELKECISQTGDPRARLWSAEVKRLINRSNVREAYFQAVSNSTWSNYAYLVASSIEGVDTMQELRMLYALHGVGLIQLNERNPSESQVLIPARERLIIDWTTCDRLVKENADFKEFIKRVRHFYQTGDRQSGWALRSN
ncbi:COG2958 family protein [Mangrovicella endophytica]|uniref:COG2958 family protein n=1 Tax=Mangrovicella endophytica TaxID=2066697 RepID=UPI000C9E27B5|nr:HrgA protein [Mangrovicella endophytica]